MTGDDFSDEKEMEEEEEITLLGTGYDAGSDSLREETIAGPFILKFIDDVSNIIGQILDQARRDNNNYVVEIRGAEYLVPFPEAWTSQDLWGAIVKWNDKSSLDVGTYKKRAYFASDEGKGAALEKMFELQIVASMRQNIIIREDEREGKVFICFAWVFDPVKVFCESIGPMMRRLNRIYKDSGNDFKSIQGRGNNKWMYFMADEIISAMTLLRRNAAEWHPRKTAIEYDEIFIDLDLAYEHKCIEM